MNIELKIKEEKELFDAWKKDAPTIIPDGVISWPDYEKSDIKILFVLKEVNSDESDWDLREFIRNGARSFTWNNITRWVKGIRNINKMYKWEDIKDVSKDDRIEYLKSIAAINVKKETGGKDVANNDIVYKHALKDKDLLNKQVKIYDPDLIICCGTDAAFVDSVYDGLKLEWKMTFNGVWYFKYENKIVVSYNHPEARVSPNFLYYPLLEALREIELVN